MVAINYDWDELEDNIDEEYDDAGVAVAEYTTEPNLFGNLVGQRRGEFVCQYHFDALGSTLAVTTADQQVSSWYSYTGFGDVVEHNSVVGDSFQYCGQRQYYSDVLANTVRRRLLSSASGRWLSADPLGVGAGINHFQYVVNRPTVAIDPAGLYLSVKLEPHQLKHCGEWLLFRTLDIDLIGLKARGIEQAIAIMKQSYSVTSSRCETRCALCVRAKAKRCAYQAFEYFSTKELGALLIDRDEVTLTPAPTRCEDYSAGSETADVEIRLIAAYHWYPYTEDPLDTVVRTWRTRRFTACGSTVTGSFWGPGSGEIPPAKPDPPLQLWGGLYASLATIAFKYVHTWDCCKDHSSNTRYDVIKPPGLPGAPQPRHGGPRHGPIPHF